MQTLEIMNSQSIPNATRPTYEACIETRHSTEQMRFAIQSVNATARKAIVNVRIHTDIEVLL